jgi:hypothetical protein
LIHVQGLVQHICHLQNGHRPRKFTKLTLKNFFCDSVPSNTFVISTTATGLVRFCLWGYQGFSLQKKQAFLIYVVLNFETTKAYLQHSLRHNILSIDPRNDPYQIEVEKFRNHQLLLYYLYKGSTGRILRHLLGHLCISIEKRFRFRENEFKVKFKIPCMILYSVQDSVQSVVEVPLLSTHPS